MNTEIEIWKDIPGYEGYYQASNLGRVKSLERIIQVKGQGTKKRKERILKSTRVIGDYLKIELWKFGVCNTFRVHQLVAMCFLGHLVGGQNIVVDHIDRNPSNNNVNNLQITTQRHNCSKRHLSMNLTSKYVGVSYKKSKERWIATIWINNNKKYLGSFRDELSASEAYQAKLKEINNNEVNKKIINLSYK